MTWGGEGGGEKNSQNKGLVSMNTGTTAGFNLVVPLGAFFFPNHKMCCINSYLNLCYFSFSRKDAWGPQTLGRVQLAN